MQAVTTATAAPARHRRTQAATLLAEGAQRGLLSWSDLAALPEWATLDAAALHRLACAAGTRAHAASLKRCIDARMLVRVRELLGAQALKSLLVDAPEPGAASLLEPVELDAASLERLVESTGRDWLLASVEQPVLRDALRERLWPDAGPTLRAIHAGAAAPVVRAALMACAAASAAAANTDQPAEQRSDADPEGTRSTA
jgi:hypothetical protein